MECDIEKWTCGRLWLLEISSKASWCFGSFWDSDRCLGDIEEISGGILAYGQVRSRWNILYLICLISMKTGSACSNELLSLISAGRESIRIFYFSSVSHAAALMCGESLISIWAKDQLVILRLRDTNSFPMFSSCSLLVSMATTERWRAVHWLQNLRVH